MEESKQRITLEHGYRLSFDFDTDKCLLNLSFTIPVMCSLKANGSN